MFLAATLFLLLLAIIVILTRLKGQMAALVAWIVGTISGAKGSDKDQEEQKEASPSPEKSKLKKSKQKQKKSPTKEPSFSTELTTPIEEIIEETLNEEVKNNDSVKSKPRKRKSVKTKSKINEPLKSKPPTEETSSDSPSSPSDSQDFGFLTVKDRRKKSSKSKIDQDVEKLKKEFVIVEKSDLKASEPIKKKPPEKFIEIVNRGTGKTVYIETKETKKVHAKISYASVTSQQFEKSLQQLQKEEEEKLNSSEQKPIREEKKEEPKHIIEESSVEAAFCREEGEAVNGDTLDLETNVNDSDTEIKSEDLINEIESEERRLVDLIEEDHSVVSEELTEEGDTEYTEQIISDQTEEENVLEQFETTYSDKIINKLLNEDLSNCEDQVQSSEDVEGSQFKTNDDTEVESQDTKEYIDVYDTSKDKVVENILLEKEPNKIHRDDAIEGLKLTESEKEEDIGEKTINGKTVTHNPVEEKDDISSCPVDLQVLTIKETETFQSEKENFNREEIQYLNEANNSENQNTERNISKVVSEYQKVVNLTSAFLVVERQIKTFNVEADATEVTELDTNIHKLNGDSLSTAEKNLEEDFETIDKEEVFEEIRAEQLVSKSETIKLTSTNKNDIEIEQKSTSKPFKMSSGIQVRVLTLNDKEHQDSTVYRLEKNWILQFRLGPSLFGRKVSLFCNYPKENEDFNRTTYNLLKWSQDEGCAYSDDTALLTELTVKISGSFHYYFTYEEGEKDEHQGSGFFLVDPVLSFETNEQLPLDCIQCQTILAKGLGPFDTWENKLKVAKESGYNMIHFTPIQELGASNSSYSLSEQLKVNPLFTKQNGEKTTFQDIENLTKKMRTEWKMLSICDIVLNHTANESEWLKEHPEVTYNCQNCPYLRPSYLLDAALHQFSIDVSKGLYEDKGIPVPITSEDHLNAIRHYLHTDVLAKLKIYELITCNVNELVAQFLNLIRNKVPSTQQDGNSNEEITLIQDTQYRRLASTVDMNLAVKIYNVYHHNCFDEETRIKKCSEEFKNKLDSLNKQVTDTLNDHLNSAVENVIAGIRYFRIQPDGPKLKDISKKNPLIDRYFTDYGSPKSIKEHEEIMYSYNGRFLMAHNGWVMNSDPLRNFAAPGSNVYIRRELIAWGDSVKLRFGDKPADSPFLWEYMKTYVETTARIFDGVRLDNCHSTPIPVAEYLLDCARKVKPDLYVVAELFTNSDLTDNIFVNRLGITSLIREALSAWDSHEQGRLVYRYGGSPVGSFYQPRIRPLVPSIAHALFLDLTHDNPSPVEKRSVFDLLPSTALVNMACCASGSNRGYDELVPHHIHVVDENRQYTEWTDDDTVATGNVKYVTKKSGIIAAKKALNDLHFYLGKEGFSQVYVDQMDPDVVAITRHCPETHESFVLVAFTAFTHPPEDAANSQRGIRPLRVEGVLNEIVLEATLNHLDAKSASKYRKTQNFRKDSKWINGLSEYQVSLKQHIQPENSDVFEKVDSGNANVIQLNFKNFKPGSVAIIKVSLPEDAKESIKNVRSLISQFSLKKETELWKIISQMALPDLNRALYRCDQEEKDEGHGFDTYDIPNFGRLVYAGLQGFMSLLATIRPNNDLGHPMCANLRDGNWMIDYIWQRLKLEEGTKSLGQWFEENTKPLKAIPRYLIPCYFDVILTGIYVSLFEQSINLMSEFVKNGSTFVRALAMGSVQFAAYIKSADLPTLSPNLKEPKPPTKKTDKGETVQACVSLSAGLPHFSVGYTRNWGRDTFIALRGMFLLTGRYQDARYHILGYAACLRHGLIPNLLDGGRNSRFNCRDALWWWLYCLKCYTEDAPDGLSILSDKVSRIFPTDDSQPQPPGAVDQSLNDVIQEALTVHFQGLVFRERNAGRQIDAHMSDAGFNNQIGIHPETGFVFGGNSSNCGTWMDKMGSSDKAGNRGKPATPRDGSAIELVGLSKAVISWLDELNKKGIYPYQGVERKGKNGVVTKWTFKEWAEKIQNNFEKCFWINTKPTDGEIRPDLINKRGIYKDCYGASQEWTDFQLRCNFPIAMVVAPELFNPQHAWIALQQAEKYLLGPLGMKTLDPEDWAYNGDYDNSNDSDDSKIAHGFNYHQGPEWVWPMGFYLRAKLQFAAANGELAKTLDNTKVVLSKHFVELQTSTWRGLPELTNRDGAFCKDSSRTQAWSMSCILEVLHDLQKIEKKHALIN